MTANLDVKDKHIQSVLHYRHYPEDSLGRCVTLTEPWNMDAGAVASPYTEACIKSWSSLRFRLHVHVLCRQLMRPGL